MDLLQEIKNMSMMDTPQPPLSDPQSKWAALVDAIESLSATHSLEQVIDIVRVAARVISGADGVTFVLREGDLCHYVDENAIAPLWKGQKFPLSACISGWTMLHKRVAAIPDIYADPRIPHDAYRPTFVKSLIMVPVRVEDPLAAIGAYWVDRHQSDENEIILMESLARATAISLANISLETSLREAADQSAAQATEIRDAYKKLQTEATQRQQTEKQLYQAQKMEAIGHLTGGMAHDFNNHLGVIIGNLDILLAARKDDPGVQEFAGAALSAALKSSDLIRGLLAFARRQPLQPQRVEANDLVRKMALLMQRMLGEHIHIELDLAGHVWPVIIDPSQLESSLANLATNARDAMPEGGRLRIATANRYLDEDYVAQHTEIAAGDYVMIEVSDTGSGIPAEFITKIFDPFFTTKEQGKGTGLGLSMVFGFIKQSGGHINVYSEVGLGTTFRLYLPRAPLDMPDAHAPQRKAITLANGEVILVVEDNPDVRRMTVTQLVSIGYRVIEATDVATALTVLETQKVDLLLTDIVMPGGRGGHDLAATAQTRWPGLRIVLMSGFPDAMRQNDPVSSDLPLLSKPFRKDDLARLLQEMLAVKEQ